MATGSSGTGSKVLTLGVCGVAPAGPQRAKVTREPVACGGVWAMHPFDLLFSHVVFVFIALFLIIVLFVSYIVFTLLMFILIILFWDVVHL